MKEQTTVCVLTLDPVRVEHARHVQGYDLACYMFRVLDGTLVTGNEMQRAVVQTSILDALYICSKHML